MVNTSAGGEVQLQVAVSSTTLSQDFDSDRDMYQLFLWVAIALFVTILVTVYTVANPTFKKDTLLYSSSGMNWDDRAGRNGF